MRGRCSPWVEFKSNHVKHGRDGFHFNLIEGDFMSENRKLLNLAQAADYLGIPNHTLHNLFYRRSNKTQPKPSYLGSRLFFHPDNLDQLAIGDIKTR